MPSYTDSSSGTWSVWIDGTSATSTDNAVWGMWVNESGTSVTSCNELSCATVITELRELTPEELERREQIEADEKAEGLLRSMLTQEQLDQFDAMAAFEVTTERARYRIERGRSGNVKELDVDGQVVASYCIHPRERVPNADTMLAQKLILESDEAEFLRVANKTQIMRV